MSNEQWSGPGSTGQRIQRDKDSVESKQSQLAGKAAAGIHTVQFLIDELKEGNLTLATMAYGLGMSEEGLKSYFKRTYGTQAFTSLSYRQKMEAINYQINRRFAVPITGRQEHDLKIMLRRIALAKVTQGIAAMDESELVRFFGTTLLKDALETKEEEREVDLWSEEDEQLFQDKVKSKKIAPVVEQGNREYRDILKHGKISVDEKSEELLKERDNHINKLRSIDQEESVGSTLDAEIEEPEDGETTIPGLD